MLEVKAACVFMLDPREDKYLYQNHILIKDTVSINGFDCYLKYTYNEV